METLSFTFPEIKTFQIPFNPKKLKFTGDVIDKTRFQKLSIDRKLIKAFNNHLIEKIDKNVLFYLKMVGQNGLIKYQNNKVSYYNSKRLLNSNVAPFEYPVDANTLGLYHLNEKSGTVAKDETGNYDGTIVGTPSMDVEGGVMSPGSYFDGVDDVIECGQLLGTTVPAEGTVETWFKHPKTFDSTRTSETYLWLKSNDETSASADYAFARFSDADGQLKWTKCLDYENGGGGVVLSSSTASWTGGKWYHYAGCWGSPGMNLYIDGVSEASNTVTTAWSADTARVFQMGKYYTGGGTVYFEGAMDEFRVSNIQRKIFGGVSPGVIF